MRNRHREKYCLRCGECCRLKEDYREVFILNGERYCPLLEWREGKPSCSIYGKNYHAVIPLPDGRETRCLSADELAMSGLLPEFCPYAKEIPNYHCRVIGYKEGVSINFHG